MSRDEAWFQEVIVMAFSCKKQKTQLILVRKKKDTKTHTLFWLVSKKFLEDLPPSQLDQGTKAELHHWNLVSISQHCLLLCCLYF